MQKKKILNLSCIVGYPLQKPPSPPLTDQEEFISVFRVVLQEMDFPVRQEQGDSFFRTAAVWHVLDKQLHLHTVT